MLEYGQPAGAMSAAWQFWLGLFASTVSILALAIILPLVAGLGGFLVGLLLYAGILALVGVRLRRGAYRSMAAGIWTGVGVALLIDGLCWVAVSGMRIGG
jgi:hypothetical protein